LRTPELRPRVLESSYGDAVSSVCIERGRVLAAEKRALPGRAPDVTAEGRLLLYFPDADLCDGAAEVASRGFFDVHNCPPWDTWVTFREVQNKDVSYRSAVLAWVPAILIADVDRGVDVNPEQCIQWLEASLAEALGIGAL
jgi:hypothetical protein